MFKQTRTRSASQYSFAQVPHANIPRSVFSRSHTHKTTFDAGYLVPIFCDEVLPGDTLSLDLQLFGRLATPIFPVMDGVYLESFFFFVPNRLLWSNWQKFMGEQENPGDSTDFLIPELAPSNFAVGTIADYFGIPTGVSNLKVNALPFRAYNLIYNEWFRDENLQDSVPVDKGEGPDPLANYKLLRRGKRHDYFTSCLPWPQKGPGVEIPIGGDASITFNQGIFPVQGIPGQGPIFSSAPASLSVGRLAVSGQGETNYNNIGYRTSAGSGTGVNWSNPYLQAHAAGVTANVTLADATAATINSMRTGFQIQKLMERDARGGTRYTEILRSHFGVISPDSRLQRPEYLGGGHSPLLVNPVTQTAPTTQTSPQGNLAAYAVVGGGRHAFSKSFVEHGYVIGLICARADLSYQQGLHKMWTRSTKYDFYWPALSHLGEQAVLNQEIYAQGTAADQDVFGYQERWAEYRYGMSKVTGKFRSTYPQNLDSWHLAQHFGSLPVLGPTFIQEDPPIDRVVAVPSEPHFILDTYFKVRSVRPMPTYSVPGLIDHF